ncbi:DUF1801 domain-containing protein [Flavobacterium ardleyense]|uniref:DUF1801 domain-containing protein n=1 Tax=Flavobacterium ardleyense TaxID=2038737 RepID=UPI00298C9CA7|nr:DUF1801 domain-containing protein [Flavobacterium ardleyense]
MESEDFELAIEGFPEEMKIIARSTRQLILSTFPKVVEVVWVKQKNIGYGIGPKKKTEHFCHIMPASKHVNLGFNYGAELDDPKCLLEGTGKLFRHIKIRKLSDLENPDLVAILLLSISNRLVQKDID